jgi:hypothetical protein
LTDERRGNDVLCEVAGMGKTGYFIQRKSRFKGLLPLLVNLPGFARNRIHPGNRHIDTEGCLLPGKGYSKEELEYVVTNSRTACDVMFLKINEALKKGEEVWCQIDSAFCS